MKTHVIEWRRLVKQGRTCERCDDTGATLRRVVRELNGTCAKGRIRFRLKTVRLAPSQIADSNMVLVDGQPLEQLVPGASVTKTDCASCAELLHTPTKCRAIVADGDTHETVPGDFVRAAICRVVNCCDAECGCGCGSQKDKAQAGSKPRVKNAA